MLDYPIQSRGGKGVQTFEFKEGKRVKPNGNRLIKGFHSKEALELVVITEPGEVHTISSEKSPIDDRKSIGKLVVPLQKQEQIIDVLHKKGNEIN
ncbi:hypothetical protein D3C77_691600 [compost metagenome]